MQQLRERLKAAEAVLDAAARGDQTRDLIKAYDRIKVAQEVER
jgi:hypothetical protein